MPNVYYRVAWTCQLDDDLSLVDGDRLQSGDASCSKILPLCQCGQAACLVDLAISKMALYIKVIVQEAMD